MVKLKGLRQINPYVAGQQPNEPDMIKLNTNENAYGPSPKVAEALQNFDAQELRKYSSLDQADLCQALAANLGVSPDQLIIGNGSDDILSMAFLAFFNSGESVLFPNLTYGFYKVWADLYQVPFREIPLTADFEVHPSDYFGDNGGIILANPNAPTGIYLPLDQLEEILASNQDVVVVVDEAYIHFGGQSALPLLKTYPNLFITRTFSKDAALAGLRVGYGIGHPDLIAVMKAIKDSINPYSVDMLAERLALAAVEDWDYYRETGRAIQETRDWFARELAALDFQVRPSQTNFVLAQPTRISAAELFQQLEERQIYVRYFPKAERIKNFLRISIGRREEMETVLAAIKEICSS